MSAFQTGGQPETINGETEKATVGHGVLGIVRNKQKSKQQKLMDKNNPPGGYDATPIPPAADGYTIKFTFHRAENLPASDLATRSSDPFLTATLTSGLPKRHKEDSNMVLRIPTVHRNTNPEWNTEWTVAGIPSTGFKLKCRLYDEDENDHDDRLGNVSIQVNRIGPGWVGIQNKSFDIEKRMGSKRAYMVRGCATLLSRKTHMNGHLWLSAEMLGESGKPHGRMYTAGSTFYFKHYSPMIGRLTGVRAPTGAEDAGNNGESKVGKYSFQANQFQLQGPVPAELYHRFVEFKPFVKGMFSKVGIRGHILNKALHHQHAAIYNFSSSTEYGVVLPRSQEATRQFLTMVHFDEGGRIFTYVLTLDGLLRFTETGKEFGIDLLSKHTMHSDVSIYIAFSGEFFVRRLAPKTSTTSPRPESEPNADLPGLARPASPPRDPQHYKLIIDNDSGTYRPKADLLPLLRKFLNENFPGLHIETWECTDEILGEMKAEQFERKKQTGLNIQMIQHSDDEISSSDEESLARRTDGQKPGKKERAYATLEDPKKAVRDLIHSEKGSGNDGATPA